MSDWTQQAADAIESAVTTARDKTVEPARYAARVAVYGTLVAFFALVAVILLLVGLFRGLNVVFHGAFGWKVWVSYAVVGGIFVIGGGFCWVNRSPKRTSDARTA
ncbi:MAG: hypothetical protein JWL73_1188 [Actinomycetia bacterium]|nr:hypothetical protein [Actinomycetes bacterium]